MDVGELDKALASGDKQKIQEVTGTITSSVEGSKGIGKSIFELTHELLPFERMVAQFRALADAGLIYTRALPSGYEIKAAPDGIEQQLLDVIDGKKKIDKKTELVFDRLGFRGDSSVLDSGGERPARRTWRRSSRATRTVKLDIVGYTDNALPAAASRRS